MTKRAVIFLETPTVGSAVTDTFSDVSSGPKIFIDFSRDQKVVETLEEHGFINCNKTIRQHHDPDQFLREFINMIDGQAPLNQNLCWWTSELATRNYVLTDLASQLNVILTIDRLMETEKYSILAIVGVGPIIRTYLRELFRKRGITVYENSYFRLIDRFRIGFLSHLVSAVTIVEGIIDLSIRIVYAKYVLKSSSRVRFLQRSTFTVIKTSITRNEIDDSFQFHDRIFGDLDTHFQENGKNVLILCHIPRNYRELVKILKHPSLEHIFPYEWFLTPVDALQAGYELLKFRPKISGAMFFGLDASSLLKWEYVRSNTSVSHYSFFRVGQRTSKDLALDRVVLTSENRGWENAFIAGLRKEIPDLPIIGYQHTVVLQAATGLFCGANEAILKPRPTKILTTGEKPREVIERFGQLSSNELETACGLQFLWLQSVEMRPRIYKNRKVLLALEGTPQVEDLVRYCIEAFHRMPQYTLIIRTHPQLPFSEIPVNIDTNQEKNVIVSEGIQLSKDLAAVDICIYWGSSVALEALSLGIPLIHFDMQTPLSHDPLLDCHNLKWTVTEPDNLGDTINTIHTLNETEFLEQRKMVKKFLSQYFSPVTTDGLNKFLQ